MDRHAHWDQEAVYHSGDPFFDGLLEELDRASHSIEVETYIFQEDVLGLALVEKLIAAAKRGVTVRLMVDGIGSPAFTPRRAAELTHQGVATRIYHPLPWNFPNWKIGQMARVTRFFTYLQKLNRRDHRKMFLIDGKTAWIGSMNVSRLHLYRYTGDEAWRDTSARVQGGAVSELVRAFDRTWLRAAGVRAQPRTLKAVIAAMRNRPTFRAGLIRLNSSRSARRHLYKDLVRRMNASKKRIWITNAYFAPDTLLLRALRMAAWTGADVRVLVPKKSDVFFMPWVTEAFYNRLLVSGARVFEYLPSFLHAKTLIIDDWAIVGSSNLNHRSLLHDLEVDVVLKKEDSRRSLEEQFLKDLQHSREILIDDWRALPLRRRIAGRIFLFFKYWF